MSLIYSSCEDVCLEAESLSLETTALLLSPKHTTAVDSALVYMGLESTTSLNQYISQEGLFSWVKQKLTKLGRKVSVAVNKIYAKLTRADKATKDLIGRASKDDTVQLPISGKKIATIGTIAAAAATVIAVTCIALSSGKKEDKEKSKSL